MIARIELIGLIAVGVNTSAKIAAHLHLSEREHVNLVMQLCRMAQAGLVRQEKETKGMITTAIYSIPCYENHCTDRSPPCYPR